MRTILVVGGGYAGFYTAWRLEKKLRRDEARIVVVDPRPYMTYQPFLPELLAGSVEARHAAWIRNIIGKGSAPLPAPQPFDAAMTKAQVLKVVTGTGFITG